MRSKMVTSKILHVLIVFFLLLQMSIWADPSISLDPDSGLSTQFLAPSSKVNWSEQSETKIQYLKNKCQRALEAYHEITLGHNFSELALLKAKDKLLDAQIRLLKLELTLAKDSDDSNELRVLLDSLIFVKQGTQESIAGLLNKEKFALEVSPSVNSVVEGRRIMKNSSEKAEVRSSEKRKTVARKNARRQKEFMRNLTPEQEEEKPKFVLSPEIFKTAYIQGFDIEKLTEGDEDEISKISDVLSSLIKQGQNLRSLYGMALTTYNLQRFQDVSVKKLVDLAIGNAKALQVTARKNLDELLQIVKLAETVGHPVPSNLKTEIELLLNDPLRSLSIEAQADALSSASQSAKNDVYEAGTLVSFDDMEVEELPAEEGTPVDLDSLETLAAQLEKTNDKFKKAAYRLKMLTENEAESVLENLSTIENTINNPPSYRYQLEPAFQLLDSLNERLDFRINLKHARSSRTANRARFLLFSAIAKNSADRFFNASTKYGQMFLKKEERKEKYYLLSQAVTEGRKRLEYLEDAAKEASSYFQSFEVLAKSPFGENDSEIQASYIEAGTFLDTIRKEIRNAKTDIEGVLVHARMLNTPIDPLTNELDLLGRLNREFRNLDSEYSLNPSDYDLLAKLHFTAKERVSRLAAISEFKGWLKNIVSSAFNADEASFILESFKFPSVNDEESAKNDLVKIEKVYDKQMEDFRESIRLVFEADADYINAIDRDLEDSKPDNAMLSTHNAVIEKKNRLEKALEAASIVRENALNRFDLEQLSDYEDIYLFAEDAVTDLSERISMIDSQRLSIENEILQNQKRLARKAMLRMNKGLRALTLKKNGVNGRAIKKLSRIAQDEKQKVQSLFDDLARTQSMVEGRRILNGILESVKKIEDTVKNAESIRERSNMYARFIATIYRVSIPMTIVAILAMGVFNYFSYSAQLSTSPETDESAEQDSDGEAKDDLALSSDEEEEITEEISQPADDVESVATLKTEKSKSDRQTGLKRQKGADKTELEKISALLTEMATIAMKDSPDAMENIDVEKEVNLLKQHMRILEAQKRLKSQMDSQELPEISNEVMKTVEEKVSIIENVLPYLKDVHQQKFIEELSGSEMMQDAMDSLASQKRLMEAIHSAA